ncbi:uncharacterized protein N7482_005093 [Penicillium canariense]|uniref:Xylanolytic transcriptional activator regulatory domain-containing protein n=1 Tax=Penicillium canariense TaxID=189055 RepID=A0A9W9I5Y2_9EURO|nr:uncharacterized protein N7482_005093 [Penicillium canariense]KAJ5166312.1 hypothetical protein N7482_005093 [Penicillium canariense]
MDRLRDLIDLYFLRVHTVRCFGFIHIPTFMRRLKSAEKISSEKSGLVYIMCALAAPFYYAEKHCTSRDGLKSNVQYFDAGRGWAEAARHCLFTQFGDMGIESIMTEVLLHEYYLRVGEYAKGFMVSGQITRHLQVVQLNMERDSDVLCQRNPASCHVKESRRRLAWACYLLDSLIECGIDQLRLIPYDDIQVQLPCTEELFITNTPCITEMLPPGKLLPSVHPALGIDFSAHLDLRAYYLRATSIRSRLLKYVKHLEGEVPWAEDNTSRFAQLNNELQTLEDSIPENMRISAENMYLFKGSGRLNLYFGLHILISQNFHDLYRVGVSNLVFPNTATGWIRENAPEDFIRRCHQVCATKSAYIASLLGDLWNCHKASLVDWPYAMHTQVCSSVIVTTIISWGRPEPLLPQLSHLDYQAMLQRNVVILQYLQRFMKVSMYCESAVQALKRFNALYVPDSPDFANSSTNGLLSANHGNSSNPSSLEYILNPLGTYPMARKQAQTQDSSTPDETEEGTPAPQVLASVEETRLAAVEPGGCPSPSGIFSGHFLDWEADMSIFPGLGYPTFLDQFPIEVPKDLNLP